MVSTHKGKVTDCSNNFSVTIAGLSDALTRGGASLSAANNSLEESIALTATANEVMQNPQVVGQALKTISMRIRGVVTDEDEDGDTVLEPAKLGKLIQDITAKYTEDGKGISILASPDEFKSTYQILLELSKVWDKLTDTERAYVLERTAGKHRATVLQAILSNEETLVESYEAALNSAGSAMEEFEKRTESVEYHLQQLTAAWQELSTNAMTTEFVNSILDTARKLVEIVNTLGAFNIAVGAGGAMAAIFGKLSVAPAMEAKFKKLQAELESTNSVVKVFGREIDVSNEKIDKWDKRLVKASLSLKGIGGLLASAFGGAAVVVGIELIAKAISKFIDEKKHEVENLTGEIDSATASIASLKSEIDSIKSDGSVTDGEERQIALLEKRIKLEEKALEVKKRQKAEVVLNDVGAYFSGAPSGVISSSIEDSLKDAESAISAYRDNLDFLEQNAESFNKSEEKMSEYLDNVVMYENEIQTLGQFISEYNSEQEKTSELYDGAKESLDGLYQRQEDLNWVLENGTEQQKEIARARKIDLDLMIYEAEVLLGLADNYDDAAKKFDQYTGAHEKLKPVVESANKQNKITVSEMETLKEILPEVAKEIVDKSTETKDGYVLEKEALDALNDAYVDSQKTVLDSEYKKTEAVVAEAQKRVKSYLLEIESLSALAETYSKSQESLGKWAYTGMGYNPYLSEEYQQYLKDTEAIRSGKAELERIQNEINSLGAKTSGTETSTTLSGDEDGNAADVFDKYANALANAREEVESYANAVELAQAQLDLNQSQEERTVDLLTQEQELYNTLLEAQQAQYKITNDTLWLQQQQLKTVQEQAKEKIQAVAPNYDVSDIENWTAADVEKFVTLHLDDSEADKDLANYLNSMVDMKDGVHELYVEWYNLKQELRETRKEELQSILDWQKDSLEQFDDARKQTEMLLDLLGEVEDTEQQRMNLAEGLAESYEAQKDSIISMHEANARKMNELAGDLENNQELYQMLLKQNEELEENYLSALQSQLSYKQQLLELEQEYAEQMAETEIYGEQGQDRWEDARQDEIDALNDQIDSLRKKAEEDDYAEQMAEYEEELAEKQEEIAELYKKLDNLRAQKTVQTLEQQEDGSWQWKYIADEIAINETLEEIADKEVEIEEVKNEMKEAEEERALEEEIEHLESQIEAIEDEVQRRQELFNQEIAIIEQTYQREKAQLSKWLQDEIANWQARIAASEQNLAIYDQVNQEGWQTATENTNTALTELSQVYTDQFNYIMSVIKNYESTAMAAVARIHAAIAAAKRAAAEAESEASGGSGSHANGLKFVEANNYVARLHYGERVLTRQEAQQYNELEDDIKSGKLAAYFESAKADAMNSISSSVSQSIGRVGGSTMPITNTTSTSFVIEHLELPNVQDSQDFAAVLQSWARNEFGGLAQKAKIVKAR